SFSRDIRPILASKCFSCHGADSSKRKADLRLDTADGALGPAASGDKAIVPGDLEASELYWRITSADPLEHMPPAKSGMSLSAAEVDRLKAWIEQGAKYENHWAFVPPKRPSVPQVHNSAWVRNPVDAFILARLEQEGLEPAPRADQVTLLRRLSLDLVGLPPTVEQVNTFLNDSDPNALDTQVERLLGSPHYGERWGGLWLDAARYADSDGFEKDKSRQVWFYRDWVIRALNRDLPYDQFVVEQIAGDLLPGASQDQVVATGFLRNSMTNEEGGIDPEQFRMEAMFDRVDAIGKGILGLTIQCAQCHDHKYDPLTQEEYYRIFAFLNNSHEATMAVYAPVDQKRRSELFGKIRAIEAELKARDGTWKERMADWEEQAKACQPEWVVVPLEVEEISNGGQKYQPLQDDSLLAQGYAPTKHRVQISARTDLQKISAFRLELLNDPNLPMGGPGRSLKGTCALTEFEVEAAPADAPENSQKIKIKSATADINPPETPLEAIFDDKSGKRRVTGPVEFAFDGKDETAWGIDAGPGRRNQPRKAVFVAETPVGFPSGTMLKIYLKQNHGGWNSDDNQSNNLGRFRLALTTAESAQADPLPAAVRKILAVPSCDRSAEQADAVFSYWRKLVPEWREANDAVEALWREQPEPSTQLVYQERSKPRMTSLLQRGDFLKP
ncbi:MAG TPA: DUF1549 domain-containing protein, partial [Isosphaeraceae bacterium]|nr:DUF1549 domain-containing protein [Isosphaeraceae bacterium]